LVRTNCLRKNSYGKAAVGVCILCNFGGVGGG
jgi:hypothetical protein